MYSLAVGALAPLAIFSLSLLAVSCTHKKPEVSFLIKDDQWPDEPRRICCDCNYFESLVFESDVFFDKSLLIKDFLEDKNKLFLITSPRDWMKTVNLEMIRQFLQIEEGSDHNAILPVTSTENYNLFVNGKVIIKLYNYSDEYGPNKAVLTRKSDIRQQLLLEHQDTRKTLNKPFLIAKHRDIVDKYLGQYPVIFFYLEMDGRKFWWDILYDFRRRIRDAYRQNRAEEKLNKLIANNDTEGMDIRRLKNITDYMMGQNAFHSLYELPETGVVLSEILYRYHKKKVFIFANEYHRPWHSMVFIRKIGLPGKMNFLHFFARFIHKTFVTNPYIEKGILSGVFPPWSEPHSTVFDNFVECNMLTGKFMEYYGINQWEMQEYFKIINMGNYTEEEFHEWFNGYRINHRPDLQIHNSWSVAQYTEEFKIEPFWAYLRSMQRYVVVFAEIASFKKQLYHLVKGGNITIRFHRHRFTWTEFEQLHGVFNFQDATGYGEDFTDKIFMFFYLTGYLTLIEDCDPSLTFKPIRLRIPNKEVRVILQGDLKQYFLNVIGHESVYVNLTSYINESLTTQLKQEFMNFLFDNKTTSPNLEKAFGEYLLDPASYLHNVTADETGEMFYNLLYYLMIDINCTLNEVWAPSAVTGRPDGLLICGNRLLPISMKFERSSIESVLTELKEIPRIIYSSKFTRSIGFVKLVAINIHRNGTVQTSAYMYSHVF